MAAPNAERRPTRRQDGDLGQRQGGEPKDIISDVHELLFETEAALVGVALNMSADAAREFMAGTSTSIFINPLHRFVWAAVDACTDDLVDPNPLTVAAAVQRRGFAIPPAYRGRFLAELHSLRELAPPTPCASWVLAQVRANAARRRAEQAAERLAAATWHGELAELAELWQREAGAVLALLAAEVTK